MNEDFDKYYEAIEPGMRERAYAWATAIGLQDVDGLKPSKYLLATAKRHIEGEISQLPLWQEYGTRAGEVIKDLHRCEDVIDDGKKGQNSVGNDVISCFGDVINDVIKFTKSEENAVKAIIRDPRLSAARLSELLGVKHRQAQRIIASLKKKAGLVCEGSRKSGIWRFPKRYMD